MKKVSLLFLLMFHLVSFGQTKYTVSGTITDQAKGETVIGARVKIKDKNRIILKPYMAFLTIIV